MTNRLIIVGSPRANGRSASLADLLFEMCIAECPDDEVALAPVSTLDVLPCVGCDRCRIAAESGRSRKAAADGAEGVGGADGAPLEGRAEEAAPWPPCAIDDDMVEVRALLDAADELVVVSPVYFAGPPAQMKALLDRLQPYFWTDARTRPKRPATLHIVGEGGDPHGFAPLIGTVRSALSCAGFALERVLDWVSRIDDDGEITAEAVEVALGDTLLTARCQQGRREPSSSQIAEEVDESAETPSRREDRTRSRPKLQITKQQGKASAQATQKKQGRRVTKPKGGRAEGARHTDGSNRGSTSRRSAGSDRNADGKRSNGGKRR